MNEQAKKIEDAGQGSKEQKKNPPITKMKQREVSEREKRRQEMKNKYTFNHLVDIILGVEDKEKEKEDIVEKVKETTMEFAERTGEDIKVLVEHRNDPEFILSQFLKAFDSWSEMKANMEQAIEDREHYEKEGIGIRGEVKSLKIVLEKKVEMIAQLGEEFEKTKKKASQNAIKADEIRERPQRIKNLEKQLERAEKALVEAREIIRAEQTKVETAVARRVEIKKELAESQGKLEAAEEEIESLEAVKDKYDQVKEELVDCRLTLGAKEDVANIKKKEEERSCSSISSEGWKNDDVKKG